MATMERGKPKQLPLLSQDTITMDTAIMEVMDTVIMERERLMLSLAITVMATVERGKLLLRQDTITMDTAIMEVMGTVIMERERLMLSLATTIMATDIMDMVDMVMATMERGKLLL